MVIRPIWGMDQVLVVEEREPKILLDLESLIGKTLKSYLTIVRTFEASAESDIKSVESLLLTASVDLVAGCEMARCGYLKQAYTLWRSWFEQAIFGLYFLEAPLHRDAWKFSDSVSLNDSPKYRLMLHQLLAESGERHAFTLVYNERYIKLVQMLKASKPPKEQDPIKRATRVLTQLSQGVHGTFRPKSMESLEKVCAQIETHGTPALEAAWSVVSEFWLLFIANTVDLPDDGWVKLRNGSLTKDQITVYFKTDSSTEDQADANFKFGVYELLALNDSFKTAFQSLKNG